MLDKDKKSDGLCCDNEFFFALLREALWACGKKLPESVSAEVAGGLLRISLEQTVAALIVDVLIRKDVVLPKAQVIEAMAILQKVRLGNLRINEELFRLNHLMQTAEADYLVVKGQVVASFYPDPLLRQSGDIDFFCDDIHFPKALDEIRKAWEIKPEQSGSDHHVHLVHNGITLEGHFSLISFYSSKKNEAWKELLSQEKRHFVNVGNSTIPTLSPTLHVFYVFMHLYHHLLELGIGLRQFCDLAVLLHACHGQIDMGRLGQLLESMGMARAYRACGSVLVDYLGLPSSELGYSLTSNDCRYGKRILKVVLYRGNMGKYHKRAGFSGWRHNVEATGIKLSHFLKFMPLSPSYNARWIGHELVRKVRMKLS